MPDEVTWGEPILDTYSFSPCPKLSLNMRGIPQPHIQALSPLTYTGSLTTPGLRGVAGSSVHAQEKGLWGRSPCRPQKQAQDFFNREDGYLLYPEFGPEMERVGMSFGGHVPLALQTPRPIGQA